MYFCKLNFVTQLVRPEVKTASPISVITSRRPLLSFYFKFNFASKNCVSNSSEVKTVSLTYCNLQFLFNKIFYEYYKDSSSFHLTMTRDRHHRLSSHFTSTSIGHCSNFHYFREIHTPDICNILPGIENLTYSR